MIMAYKATFAKYAGISGICDSLLSAVSYQQSAIINQGLGIVD
jgi:hypothetical protein